MPLRVLLASLASAALTLVGVLVPASARPLAADGVLFYPSVGGVLPALQAPHFCSASVVHSSGRNLIITAAHCVYGTGATIEFVPGFHDGQAPYGVWSLTSLYVPTGWQFGQDPASDVAFATIARLGGQPIEDVVGGRPLGTPIAGAPASASGYPLQAGTPTTCNGRLSFTGVYPTLDCPSGGMTDGVSGGAFVQGSHVVGVIGGLEQGGCSAFTDYSAPFGASTFALWQRAESGAPGDVVLPGFLANSCTGAPAL